MHIIIIYIFSLVCGCFYIVIYAYMLKKYSHFSDLQAADKYKTNSTIGCMLSLTGHAAPMAASSLGEGGVKNFRKVFARGKRGGGGGSEIQKFLFGWGGYIVWGGSNFVWGEGGGGGHIILKKKSKLRNTSIKSIFGITKLIS